MKHAIRKSILQLHLSAIEHLGVTFKPYNKNKAYMEIKTWPKHLSCREVKDTLRSIGIPIDLVNQYNVIPDTLV